MNDGQMMMNIYSFKIEITPEEQLAAEKPSDQDLEQKKTKLEDEVKLEDTDANIKEMQKLKIKKGRVIVKPTTQPRAGLLSSEEMR
jgi:hypothetical protein